MRENRCIAAGALLVAWEDRRSRRAAPNVTNCRAGRQGGNGEEPSGKQ
jgi:hypothetical protein